MIKRTHRKLQHFSKLLLQVIFIPPSHLSVKIVSFNVSYVSFNELKCLRDMIYRNELFKSE